MICTFLNTHLTLPKLKEEKITSTTSQLAFVRKHKSDIEKEMGAIWAMVQTLPELKKVADLMAGSGFSGKVFKHRWPECDLFLNDLSTDCAKALKDNFPTSEVQNTYSDKVVLKDKQDLIFIDFNNYTIQRSKDWITTFNLVKVSNPEWFLFTDSASYSFKFNKTYRKETYYQLLDKQLRETYGWNIHKVCVFGNAALVLCSVKPGNLEFLDFKPIHFSIQSYLGFFDV